jgi:hypothetical protein
MQDAKQSMRDAGFNVDDPAVAAALGAPGVAPVAAAAPPEAPPAAATAGTQQSYTYTRFRQPKEKCDQDARTLHKAFPVWEVAIVTIKSTQTVVNYIGKSFPMSYWLAQVRDTIHVKQCIDCEVSHLVGCFVSHEVQIMLFPGQQ